VSTSTHVTVARPARRRRAPLGRLDPFPRDRLMRWGMRLFFALPGLFITWRASAGAVESIATPNQQLLDHISAIEWSSTEVLWLGDIFPPLSTLLVAVIPGGRLGLSIVGSLFAGLMVQKALEILLQRRFPVSTAVILTIALAANPLFTYTVTENLPALLGLGFFSFGIAEIVRFVAWRNTQSGFRAGLFLMLATLSDPSGLLYVLVAAVVAAFLRLGRSEQPGARAANLLVILYPTLAAALALLLLNTMFIGDPLGELATRMTTGSMERLAALPAVYSDLNGWLLFAPVASAWLVAIIVWRPASILVSTMVFVAINAAYVWGLLPDGSAGNTFIVMTLMAIAFIPKARGAVTRRLVDLVALGQIAIAWAAAFNREIVVHWWTSLGTPVLDLIF
tara:strand:- start:169890 stop:171071 length:1182 start_codon:yes stop_codon:yes gene_type:complete